MVASIDVCTGNCYEYPQTTEIKKPIKKSNPMLERLAFLPERFPKKVERRKNGPERCKKGQE